MYSFEFIKDNFEVLRYFIELKGLDTDIEYIYQLTLDRTKILKDFQAIHKNINSLNRAYMELNADDPKRDKLHEELKNLSKRKKHIRKSQKEIDSRLHELLLTIPNIPNIALYHPGSQVTSEDSLQKQWYPMEMKTTEADPSGIVPHYEMAQKLRIYDHHYTKKISAPKFMLYLPKGSQIVSKISGIIVDFFLEAGFQRLYVSEVIDRDIIRMMGYLLEDRDMYLLQDMNLQLSPSGHISILNMLSKMNLEKASFPIKLFAVSNCFRKEIGGYGKENRGLLRMYQFLKNDSIIISDPDESYEYFEYLSELTEKLIKQFKIPYRIMSLSYANTPFTSSRTLLFQSLLPSLGKWINLLSISNTEEFLSRRINLQFRHHRHKEKDFPHIIHISGPSVERLIALILEHLQYISGSDAEDIFTFL